MFRFIDGKARKVAIGILVAAVVPASVVASGFGNGGADRRAAHTAIAGQFRHVQVTAATVTTGIKFVYVRGSQTVSPGQFFQGSLRCPTKYPHPISGFFDTDSANTYLATNRPDPDGVSSTKARKWEVGVTNAGAKSAGVTAGVVCAK